MPDVPGNSRHPPTKPGMQPLPQPVCRSDNRIWNGTEKTKTQAKDSGHNAPEPDRLLPSEFPCDQHQKRPHIKIHPPPKTESIYTALYQDKHWNHEENLPPEKQREHNQPKGGEFNIGQKCQRHFAHLNDSSHHAHQCNIAGRNLTR